MSCPVARGLAAACVAGGLLLAFKTFPASGLLLFCAPAAWLSSQWLGVSMLPLTDGFRLDCPLLKVDVTLACSGTTFFTLLFALLLLNPSHVRRGGATPDPSRPSGGVRLAAALKSLAFAYAITLAANTARIALGWHAAVWARTTLPPSFHPGVHLAVGLVIFSAFLIAGTLAGRMPFRKEHQPWAVDHDSNPEP
jgi:hypothetical protein